MLVKIKTYNCSYTLILHHCWAEIELMHGKLMNKYYNIIIISDGSSGGARGALAPPTDSGHVEPP